MMHVARQAEACTEATPSAVAKVLIVDDLEDARWVMSNLVQQAGYMPVLAENGEKALIAIRQQAPDLVLLDVRLPDMHGFEVLARARAQDKSVPVIMLTAHGETKDAVRAMRAGAYDYVTKPFDHGGILLTLRSAIEERVSKRRLREMRDSLHQAHALLGLMGNSEAVQAIVKDVVRAAATNFSVLVTGETGTGKELVAQAIHAESQRSAAPLVVVDCGAIPELLIESELFGHDKGAFTGAHQAKPGAFELAHGGTIFLDEIGNLPMVLQAKLLRALETRRIHHVGGAREQKVDFRVVAATNMDLRSMIDRQLFRSDLYHRLAEFEISVPPLRERKEDLSFLIRRFLTEANKELGKRVGGLSQAAWEIMRQREWPGNVRELRNLLRRAVLLSTDTEESITPELLGVRTLGTKRLESLKAEQAKIGCPRMDGPGACPLLVATSCMSSERSPPLKELVGAVTAQMERAILLRALELTDGNKAQSARLLRIDYKTIHSKLKAHGISSNQLRGGEAKRLGAES